MILKGQVFGVVVSLAMLGGLGLWATVAPAKSGCLEAVDAFISLPTEKTLMALVGSGSDGCWSVVGASNATQDQLNHWAGRGNRWAARYLAEHLKQLDGGNLEDALVALGQFSDRDMQSFLLLAKAGLLSKREFDDALTMLPPSLSDDPRAQLSLLGQRKNNVMRVTRKDLSHQKAQALVAIDGFASEIRSKEP